MHNRIKQLGKISFLIKQLHSNLFLLIGGYGILAIFCLVVSINCFFEVSLNPIYLKSLPPAWWQSGDINHLLGTNNQGQDIFYYLLISYCSTISMTITATLYVIFAGAVINYLMFFIPLLRATLLLILRSINTIPPLFSVIAVSLLAENSVTYMLIMVAAVYLPRFAYNVHLEIIKESNKTYIAAYRLDGLSELKIFSHCIIPNIMPAYLTKLVILIARNLLAITALTFLGFSQDIVHPDLGMMIFQMKELLTSNYWAFLAPGLLITITITCVFLLNLGLFNDRLRG